MQEKSVQNGNSTYEMTTNPGIKFPKEEDSLSEMSRNSEDRSRGPGGLCCADAGNPAYKRGRRFQLTQMIVLPFIPILALIVQTAMSLQYLLEYRNDIEDVETQVQIATDLGKFVTQMQLERSEVAFFVFTNKSSQPLRSNISEQFAMTNQTLEKMITWPPIRLPQNRQLLDKKEEFITHLCNFRQKISSEESTVQEVLAWYTSVNAAMLDHLTTRIKETDNSGVWRYLLAFKNILRSIENMGIALTYGISYYGRGQLSTSNYISYVRHESLGSDLLNASLNYALNIKELHSKLIRNLSDYEKIQQRSEEILRNQKRNASIEDAMMYTDSLTSYIDELRKLQYKLRVEIKRYVDRDLKEAANKEAIGIAILITVLVISPVIIILVRNAVATIQMYAANLADKARELNKEKKKSDALLFQMLPTSVAQQLKQMQQVPAEYYEAVTVYFCDIVGFTEIAAISTPLEVVSFLNSIYKLFDARIECYDVYKVESSGDSYMVASGLPVKNGNKHVTEIATMALDLLAGSSVLKVPHRGNETLQIRSGCHTGPVVAGIVGTKMPRYCLYGDTVNTASRMESTGEAQRVHISLEMKRALDEAGGFKTEHRGLVYVKGKGEMDTYWLTCKDGGLPKRPDPPAYDDAQPQYMKRFMEGYHSK
ncbi:UNVERIFIED_CONTAM: hypothetical protein PYX00_010526 [Menopon gallinae]|uniref:guanylate cyclase n=1 Tax=Menopon gallinae TaxID=328185 RepID=A0AAW2HFU9_9NEOP